MTTPTLCAILSLVVRVLLRLARGESAGHLITSLEAALRQLGPK